MNPKFVNIALDLPIDKLFTYKVPDYLDEFVEPGKRVLVNFGKKTLTGVIVEIVEASDFKKTKDVKSFLDSGRIFNDEYLEFSKWISNYYVSPVGEVIFSSLPSKINLKTEKYYQLNNDYRLNIDKSKLQSEIYWDILDAYQGNLDIQFTKQQIENKLNTKNLTSYLSLLEEKNILTSYVSFSKTINEKFVKIVTRNYNQSDFENISKNLKSKIQKEILELFNNQESFEFSELAQKFKSAYSAINSLNKKNLVKLEDVRKFRNYSSLYQERTKTIEFTDEQKFSFEKIDEAIASGKFNPFLLYGITGSGKTEIYLDAIAKVIALGKTAIVLVPEISLTPQLIYRFQQRFGDIIGVIHSRISEGQKLDTFDRIFNGLIKIVIGARSAIFAPLKNIGIIIVDEEHDSSYKQNNSPRYNGRDAALVRAKINNAVIILGSATPSLESYYNTKTGKYQLLSLTKRATNIKLPDIEIVDLKAGYDRKEVKTSEDFLELIDKTRVRFLSKKLIYLISERIDKKESVILLQNRRGYHSYIECLNCGNVEMCIRCNISLTYHKAFNNLKCHYCGFSKPLITKCSNCSSAHLIQMGTGTEKVEEELIKLFQKAVIKRVDSDYITSAKKYQEVLNDFYNKKIDVLVGTQLLSKGLDFPNVTLVGVINADIGLLYPDFRASERTFQILTQVAGRSGRDLVEGEVLIQTNHSEYEVFNYIKKHDYINFYNNEIKLREKTLYPPYSRIALIEMKSMDRNICESKIKEIYNFISSNDKSKILELLPPNPPLFSKLKDFFRYHLLIKSPKTKDKSGNYLLSILHKAKEYADKNFPQSVRMIIDMDAIDLL